jgi:predicted GNAT superfamily acetyltransferase
MSNPATADPKAIVIRDITELPEMRQLEKLQKEVWGVEDLDVYPALAFRPQVAVGAVLVGAFYEDRMVGFVFGFPGVEHGETILHSDMLGVLPEFRRYGLGYLLKLAQREHALQAGYKRITWTFDPLQLRNANLNFARLGVTSTRYLVNFYGETSSFLHSSGTDRLWVDWMIDSNRVRDRIEQGSSKKISNEELEGTQRLVNVAAADQPETVPVDQLAERLAIEIPSDINELVKRADGSAQRWRESTRDAFTRALDSGYTIEEFVVLDDATRSVGCYLLSKQ